jgi:hypothetical protein
MGQQTAMTAVRPARLQYLRYLTTLVHRAGRQPWAKVPWRFSGRRTSRRLDQPVIPASENLHNC